MTNTELPKQTERTTSEADLQQALAHQQAGEFQEAGEIYLSILQAEPNHPQANHNMGVLAVQMQQPAASLPYFISALDADPARAQYWLSYIDALCQAEQLDDARQILALAQQQGLQGDEVDALAARLKDDTQDSGHPDPKPPPAPTGTHPRRHDSESKSAKTNRTATKDTSHKGRAPSQQDINALITLFSSGRLQEAVPVAQAMTEHFPRHEFGWKALGAIYKRLGRSTEALHPMRKAAELSPRDLEAHFNLGVTLQELGKSDEAESCYRRALDIDRNYAPAHANLGVTLQRAERLPEAEASYRQAIKIDPRHTKALSNLGVVLQRLGRLSAAEASHKQALALNPGNAETHVNLGNLFNEQHRDEEAELHFKQALNIAPDYAEAHYNLANMLQRTGRLDEAEAHYQRTLKIKPDFANAHYNLGNLFTELDRPKDAEGSFRRAIDIDPNFAEAHFNLGILLARLSRSIEAEHCFRQALEKDPKYTEAYCRLGDLFFEQARYTEAEHCFRLASDISPNDSDAHCKLGNSLYLQKRLSEAAICYWNAIKISPDSADANCNLGVILIEWNRLDEAIEALLHSRKIDPEKPNTHFNLGNAYLRKGQLIESEACLLRALELRPDFIGAQSALGNTLLDMGRLAEARTCYRKVLSAKPESAAVHSNLLFSLLHDEALETMHIFSEHRHFGERFDVPPEDIPAHSNSREPERRLNIGFVSADFRHHAVAFFIEPILVHLASQPRLSLHAYSNIEVEDSVTKRLRELFKHWHPIASLSDDELEEKIRADDIDILIDLSGHTSGNRLLTFARKPAPIQASWIGYPATTGLHAIDYYLADHFLLPEGMGDEQFTEKIVRLPASAPFLPFDGAPPINTLPALQNGRITFGSFNRLNKLNRSSIALWARLLRALPESRILLAAMPENRKYESLIEWFTQEGIAPERLSFLSRCAITDYLAQHHQVDICLDTAPYNGATTTLHALWMGVPTLTMASDLTVGRSGTSILRHADLETCIANDADEFVRKGVALAEDLAALSDIRMGLRERVARSVISQPAVIAAGVARALRIMWQRWCAGSSPVSFEVTRQEIEVPVSKTKIDQSKI